MSAPSSSPENQDRPLCDLLLKSGTFIFSHTESGTIAVFSRDGGAALPVRHLSASELSQLVAQGTVLETSRSERGCRYLHKTQVPEATRAAHRREQRKRPANLTTKRYVQTDPDAEPIEITVNLGESPLGWLAKRRNARGEPFLSEAHVIAGERLRADFEHARLGPRVTQDWRRFLCAGVEESGRSEGGAPTVTGSAEAARRRVLDALDALGPDLSDAVFRTCCFLEGLESVERDLDWSARSGKIVLRIALQRLSRFYEQLDLPKSRKISMFDEGRAS